MNSFKGLYSVVFIKNLYFLTHILDNNDNCENSALDKNDQEEMVIIDQASGDNIGDMSSMELHDWKDLRKFNEDHDDDWFSCQERKLGKCVKYKDTFPFT